MISVIIPTFNRRQFLKKTVKSVLSQTLRGFELIIVDDGSSDGTREDFLNHSDERLRYFFQENKGPASARNLGIRKSKGELIAFVDSDDRWDERKLEIQYRAMREDPVYSISHTQELWYRDGRILNQKKKHKKENGYIFGRCLEICAVSMSTVMIRKEALERIGLFNENMPCCEDYDFWIRAGAVYDFLLIDRPLTLKDGGRKDQLSHIYKTGIDRFRIDSIARLLDSGTLSEEQSSLARKELMNKCLIYAKGCQKHGNLSEVRRIKSIMRSHTLP